MNFIFGHQILNVGKALPFKYFADARPQLLSTRFREIYLYLVLGVDIFLLHEVYHDCQLFYLFICQLPLHPAPEPLLNHSFVS